MNLFSLGRKRLSLVMQEANGECGIACLAMVARWHGHRLDLPYLRATYPTTRRGLSVADLIAVAQQLQLQARGLRIDSPDELRRLVAPAILHWSGNHFVVYKGFEYGRFVIFNPAAGVRRYTAAEMADELGGVVLELQPADNFEIIVRSKRHSLWQILDRTNGLRLAVVQMLAVAVAGALIAMLLPVLVQVALDSVLPRSDVDLLLVLAGGLFLVSITVGAAEWLQRRIVANVGGAFFAQLTHNAVSHLMRLPLRYFESRHPGDVATRLDSVEAVRSVITGSLVEAGVSLIIILLSGAIMFLYAPALAALVTAIFLGVVAIRLLIQPGIRRQATIALKSRSDERSRLIDTLRAISAVKSANAGPSLTRHWYESFVRHVNAGFRIKIAQADALLLVEILTAIGMAVTLYFGVAAVIAQKMTVGMLYAFFTYRTLFFDRIDTLVTAMTEVSLLGANMNRLSDFLEEEPEPLGQMIERRLRQTVALRDAGFSAGFADPPILQNIDLTLPVANGQTIVILGPSGSGKTTLLKILAGLYQPTSGQLLIDGVPLAQWGLAAWRRNVGVLMGNEKLLRGSILENVSSFALDPDPVRAMAALRIACLDIVVEELPRRLETVISEENGILSSGQRRRLLLARALYQDPPLLLLDEVTANLDGDTARDVLHRLAGHPATKIITSHDPLVLGIASEVRQLAGGQLGPSITPDQLAATTQPAIQGSEA